MLIGLSAASGYHYAKGMDTYHDHKNHSYIRFINQIQRRVAMKHLVTILFSVICGTFPAFSADTVAVIQFIPEKVDTSTAKTINDLFYESLQEFGLKHLQRITAEIVCREKGCALKVADSVGAQKVIYCTARILGSKWIVRSFYYRVKDGKQYASNSLDCRTIEDFEPVMRRHAEAIAKDKTVEQVASIDNVVGVETDETRFKRREGFYSLGIQFGYLYPYRDNSYTHWQYDGTDYEDGKYREKAHESQYKQVLATDFINWFELPNNLSVQWDVHIGWGADIGTHLILLRQFGRGDFSPYAGGGVGIDYCFNGNPSTGLNDVDEDKRNGGFTLLCKAGLQLMRTYNFRVHIDGGYKYVLNDDRDQGPYTNIGLMWRKQPRNASYSHGTNPVVTVLSGIGGLVLLLGVISLVAF